MIHEGNGLRKGDEVSGAYRAGSRRTVCAHGSGALRCYAGAAIAASSCRRASISAMT